MDTKKGREVLVAIGMTLAAATACGESAMEPVRSPVTAVMIAPADGVWTGLLTVGDSVMLTAQALDEGGGTVPGHTAAWATSDSAVATVSTDGVLRAVGPGATQVWAVMANVRGQTHLTVTERPGPAVTIGVTPQAAVLAVGQSQQYAARAYDATGAEIQGASVTWTNDSPSVISLSATGLATALAPGYGQVTATILGESTSVGLTVATPGQKRE